MKNNLFILSVAMLFLSSCSKEIVKQESTISPKTENIENSTNSYVKYTILKDQQYCDKSIFVPVKYSELSFKVKFDSSAIYKTIEEKNQSDINKLFGFSDNNAAHHEYSARFGWRWSDNALRLFAYIYNNSVMSFKEIGIVKIGTENICSIKVDSNKYIFSLNKKEVIVPRESTTTFGEGYKLFPYFGGDELAPHDISIWIEEL
jgi:hypothetical protein